MDALGHFRRKRMRSAAPPLCQTVFSIVPAGFIHEELNR